MNAYINNAANRTKHKIYIFLLCTESVDILVFYVRVKADKI